MSMSDWSSYVCSSDLCTASAPPAHHQRQKRALKSQTGGSRRPLKSLVLLKNHWSGREDSNLRPPHPQCDALPGCATPRPEPRALRSEEHTSELQSLMRNSYAVFCLIKKKKTTH